MKRIMGLMFASVAILALSGCETGSDDNSSSGPNTYADVNVLDLTNGYIIEGYNDANEEVTLEFCRGEYTYYSGSGRWYGTFSIKEDRINMFDKTATGGSYRIDTYNNYLEVNNRYSIDFQNDEIIVDQILEDLGC